MCNKSMRNRNKHHTLGVVAQSTLSNQHNPCSCARSDEKGFGFLRFGEENFCLFAAVMLLLVSKEGDVCTFFREDCTRASGNVGIWWDTRSRGDCPCTPWHPALAAQAVLMNPPTAVYSRSCSRGWLPRILQLQGCGISPGTLSPRPNIQKK